MFKNMIRTATAGLILTVGLALTGCLENGGTARGQEGEASGSPASLERPISFEPLDQAILEAFLGPEPSELEGYISFNFSPGALARQLAQPEAGEVYAVIHTSMGPIFTRLFPQYAPLAVRNFATHANEGFFDGLIFHRVIPNFMIQGGCTLGTGTGGESIWGQAFNNELTSNLAHIRGALSMANTGFPFSNRSQFFVVQNPRSEVANDFLQYFEQVQDVLLVDYFGPEEVRDEDMELTLNHMFPREFLHHYANYGGTRHLDFLHTVFGHVFYGMDVVDAIAAVDAISDRPIRDVYIITVELRVWE